MARKTKNIYGPIATNLNAWPPLRKCGAADQEVLQQLLDQELTAHWQAIAREEGATEEVHARLLASRGWALARADHEDMAALQQFIANSIGPDGKKVGEKIANLYVKKRDRAKGEKLPPDHWYQMQAKSHFQKWTEAVWEADRAKAIIERVYGRTPDGYAPRTDLIVAAKRSGVSESEIRNWQDDERCPDDGWPIPTPASPPYIGDTDPTRNTFQDWLSKAAVQTREE